MSDQPPTSWSEATVGDVCLPVSQRGPSSDKVTFQYVDLGALDNKSKRIVEPGTVPTSEAPSRAKQILKAGDVLFSTVRVYLENIALVPAELDGEVASTAFCVLRPAKGIDSRYLYYYVTSRRFILSVNELQRGNSPPSVQEADVRGQPFPIAPASEQARIASKIDELFSRIDEGERALERVRKLVERYRQSVLKAAVTGELTREWREKNKDKLESGEALLARILEARREAWEKVELEKMKAKGITPTNDKWKQKYESPTPLNTEALPDLPEGWVWASVDQLCLEFGNGLSRKPANQPPGEPILRISAVRPLAVDTSDVRFYVLDDGESVESYYAQPGDLLFTRYNGSRDLVGVSGIVKRERVLHPDKLIKARPVAPNLIRPDYLAIAMNSGSSWRHITSCVKTSAGQHGIAGSDLKRAPVPIPPTEEQDGLVEAFNLADAKCSELRSVCLSELRRSHATRQAVLKTAFAGLLVGQDPSDEPATILLECIAAERGANNPAPKRGRAKKTAA